MISTRRILLLLPLLVVLAAGCKTSRTPSKVSGKVTYKGQVVGAGTITFNLKEGGGYPDNLKADGSYTLTGLPAEEMIVTIDTESANPNHPKATYGAPGQKGKEDQQSQYARMMKEKGFGANAPADTGKYVPIPKKYADKEKSPLKVTLTSGDNVKNFDLTD